MKQFWPLSHENYPAKVDQLKIFDDQKIQNAFCTSFFVLTPRITFLRTKIWTFQISSTAKMSKFEKLFNVLAHVHQHKQPKYRIFEIKQPVAHVFSHKQPGLKETTFLKNGNMSITPEHIMFPYFPLSRRTAWRADRAYRPSN